RPGDMAIGEAGVDLRVRGGGEADLRIVGAAAARLASADIVGKCAGQELGIAPVQGLQRPYGFARIGETAGGIGLGRENFRRGRGSLVHAATIDRQCDSGESRSASALCRRTRLWFCPN